MQRGNPAAYQARSCRRPARRTPRSSRLRGRSLGRGEDRFGIPGLDPAHGQGAEVLSDDLEHDTDGEDDHGGADRPHAEEREEAETRGVDGDGLHEVGRADLWQEPGVPEYEHQLEQFGHEEERDCPLKGFVPNIVHDEDIHLLL